jgi:D-cysteine desulfhydrase family pyridoxal phosphate-dependent enzyme
MPEFSRQDLDRIAPPLVTLPRLTLSQHPTPVEPLDRLRASLGGGPTLLVKRDDAIAFGGGGNKVRKLEFVAARALDEGADVLVTIGGTQSNHCRATAAVCARLGIRCSLVLSGPAPERASGNLLLDRLFGAEVQFVASRAEREPAMQCELERLRRMGLKPFGIPLGASTPLGAAGYALALLELVNQGVRPDVIVHATSSGGTQAGLMVGCVWAGLHTRVIGISADDPAEAIVPQVQQLAEDAAALLDVPGPLPLVEVDDRFVGEGYGVPTSRSREATELFARSEALLLDPTYTAKAAAALIAFVRGGAFAENETVLFWHTGGIPGLFA